MLTFYSRRVYRVFDVVQSDAHVLASGFSSNKSLQYKYKYEYMFAEFLLHRVSVSERKVHALLQYIEALTKRLLSV